MPIRSEGFRMGPEHVETKKSDLDRAFEKAESVLQVDKVDPKDFIEVYGQDMVESDLREVERLKRIFAAKEQESNPEIRKLATVLEAIIHHQIEANEWFGPNVNTIKPTEFDDYVNKVDEIVEFEEEQSATYMGLAIDATISAETTKKLKQIREEIDRGQLPKIKYFQSEHLHFKGQKANLPRVIVEIHPETIKKLMGIWIHGKNKQLAEHPVQLQVLDQIHSQLKAFELYARTIGRTEIADVYKQAANKVATVLKGKDLLRKKLTYDAVDIDDGSTYNLQEEMKRVFTEIKI